MEFLIYNTPITIVGFEVPRVFQRTHRLHNMVVPEDGLEPSRGQAPRDFKSLVSTDSTTQASLPAMYHRR